MKSLLLLLFVLIAPADEGDKMWNEAYNKNGIKVSTRIYEGEKVKEIKAELIVPYSVKEIIPIFKTPGAMQKWLYNIKVAKRLDPDHVYFSLDFPWPLLDRDVVGQSIDTFNEDSTYVNLKMIATPAYIPENNEHVRIENMVGQWTIKKIDESHSYVSNQFFADPKGLPAWIINTFSTEGPVNTIHGMVDYLEGLYGERGI